ncbi:hypothetical protein C8F04DRAFT_1241536 [Mycena alexandri]|uniref:F-box domain-containing protein n=1 Tax=Mycena alexandri TaxID=1745969 RepID=A0AAD6WNJ5_9AGAR|nr:hypothetical protein C8F04DRAFT_1241536 [Mycena alexandri]
MPTEQDSLILSVFPPEITQKVFRHCLLPQYGPAGPPRPLSHRWSPSPREAPLLFTQICRQWRDICLNAPDLWTSIDFDENQSIEYLLTSLSRAGNGVPLSLRIRASDSTAALVMDMVIPSVHRWQRIHLILPAAELVRLHMHHFPILEQLTLCVFEKESRMTKPTVIQNGPLLSYADARTFPTLHFAGSLHLLTRLRLHALDTSQTMATLRQCPNLLDLTCDYRDPYPYSFLLEPPEPLELPSLCLLKVTDHRMLPFLATPNLERLHLQYTSRNENVMGIPRDALGSFLTRSGCDLLFLSINTKEMPYSWLMADRLRPANSVRHLSVTVADSGDFMSLMSDISLPSVLPRLVHLEVRDPAAVLNMTMEQYDAMLKMLPMRRKHTALEKVELFFGRRSVGGPRTPHVAVMQELRRLAEEKGLQVRITARNRLTSPYVDVRLFDNFDGNALEYTYIPTFEA